MVVLQWSSFKILCPVAQSASKVAIISEEFIIQFKLEYLSQVSDACSPDPLVQRQFASVQNANAHVNRIS